jgi:hypothetical protein
MAFRIKIVINGTFGSLSLLDNLLRGLIKSKPYQSIENSRFYMRYNPLRGAMKIQPESISTGYNLREL